MTDNNKPQEAQTSCDPKLSRSEFLRKLVAPAAAVGVAALLAPKIADKFMLPAQAAPAVSVPNGGRGVGGFGGPSPGRRSR